MDKNVQPTSVCPKCGMKLILIVGDFGKFIGCTGYPQCDYSLNIQDEIQCPSCGKLMQIREGQYGKFLCRIFDRWMKYGPQNLSVRNFDSILSYCMSGQHTVCTFDRHCNHYIVIEYTGDAFGCDFFVDPKWRLGNIMETDIEKLAENAAKLNLMQNKLKLCNKCFACSHLEICWGGCLKYRSPLDPQNYTSESYFCESYRMFFDYAMPRFMKVADKFRSGSLVRPDKLV